MIDAVTSRYAEALFSLAKRRGVLANVRADVARLASELREGGALAVAFDERLSIEARRSRLGPGLAGLHPLMQDFVGLVLDKRRVEVLRHLGAAFHRRDLTERGAAEGLVESARPLDKADIAGLAAAIGQRLGKDLALENRVVPELIGGVRVVVGSKMIDASVAGHLEDLRKDLLTVPLPRSA